MLKMPWSIGLAQAAGVYAYIGTLIVVVQTIGANVAPPPGPILAPMLFLLTFSTSALICAVIVFGYPALLFSRGDRRTAFAAVLWTAAFLFALLALTGTVILVRN